MLFIIRKEDIWTERGRLDFAKLGQITFEEPDMETFLGLPMAVQAARRAVPCQLFLNAANRACSKKFLHEEIRFSGYL